MTYREFYIRITAQKIAKTAPDGNPALCNGFLIQICDSKDKNTVIDFFTAAAGFELLENSMAEANSLPKIISIWKQKNSVICWKNITAFRSSHN